VRTKITQSTQHRGRKGDVLSGNLKKHQGASIAFVWSNTLWANPKPLWA